MKYPERQIYRDRAGRGVTGNRCQGSLWGDASVPKQDCGDGSPTQDGSQTSLHGPFQMGEADVISEIIPQ